MKRIHLFLASALCLGLVNSTPAQQIGLAGKGGTLLAQRADLPPGWSIGNWVGRNDFRKNDVDLQISDDGRASITYRVGTNVQTFRGSYRDGRLEVGGQRFFLRQRGDDLELTRDDERRDSVILHRVGRGPGPGRGDRVDQLNLRSPRNNERFRSRTVEFSGESDAREVEIQVRRDGRDFRRIETSVRNGRFNVRMELQPGRYEAIVDVQGRGRERLERRVSFTVGSDRTRIESPNAGENFRTGVVPISGTSEADEVEVEIYRGRDRVFIERVRVRDDGTFVSRPSLGWGTYVLTVRGKEGGQTTSTDKRGFEVDRGRGNDPRPDDSRFYELRLNNPSNRERITDGTVEVEGSTNAPEVRIEIFRGRDRIQERRIDVRNGRFYSQFRLGEGRYDVVVTVQQRGRESTERRASFEVVR